MYIGLTPIPCPLSFFKKQLRWALGEFFETAVTSLSLLIFFPLPIIVLNHGAAIMILTSWTEEALLRVALNPQTEVHHGWWTKQWPVGALWRAARKWAHSHHHLQTVRKKKQFFNTQMGYFDCLVYPIVEMEHMQREHCVISLRSLQRNRLTWGCYQFYLSFSYLQVYILYIFSFTLNLKDIFLVIY